MAAWTSPAGDQRWYIIPDATDWTTILDWLVQQALPTYVPDALRRVRSPHFVDPALQTVAEQVALEALAELEARYAEAKLELEEDLQRAKAAAEPVRYGLLYGSAAELVTAVAAVLTAADLATINLDEELGGTRSADLLVCAGPQRRLVEVKATGGAAPESLVGHLDRHLATWPQLRPHQPVEGGVLIVNHQHKLHPAQRATQVYSRPEFVDALTVPVISTVELFDWWRTADWASIQAAVLGTELSPAGPTPNSAVSSALGTAAASTAPPSPSGRPRRWLGMHRR